MKGWMITIPVLVLLGVSILNTKHDAIAQENREDIRMVVPSNNLKVLKRLTPVEKARIRGLNHCAQDLLEHIVRSRNPRFTNFINEFSDGALIWVEARRLGFSQERFELIDTNDDDSISTEELDAYYNSGPYQYICSPKGMYKSLGPPETINRY